MDNLTLLNLFDLAHLALAAGAAHADAADDPRTGIEAASRESYVAVIGEKLPDESEYRDWRLLFALGCVGANGQL